MGKSMGCVKHCRGYGTGDEVCEVEANGVFGRRADVGRHKRIPRRQMGIKSCPIAKTEYGSGTRVRF